MSNFTISFAYPWLLLLLIPAVVLTFLPYFRLNKRYRKNRNRITSLVLHLLVMILSISILSGMVFLYQEPNEENEIILLVDVSDTEEESAMARDEFIDIVLKDADGKGFKVGVVTFGFDQEYVVPLTYEIDTIYEIYQDSLSVNLPDTTATNIASALRFTKDLFSYPETAKIVLVTDGKETDDEALSVVRAVAAQGTSVDIAHVPSAYTGDETQIVDVKTPDRHVNVGETCEIEVTIQSNCNSELTVKLSDNGEVNADETQYIDTFSGEQAIKFEHTFTSTGLHELAFNISSSNDSLEQNNEYISYFYLEVFNKILILERSSGESDELIELINDEEEYEIEVVNVLEDTMPSSVDELRAYDQVILNNISNEDLSLTEGFDIMLTEYVEVYGGGLFTVGGVSEEDGSGNNVAYNRKDLYGSTYQSLLPVQAINYTPPLGVVVIIDASGSMASTDDYGDSKLEQAKAGAYASLSALSERDYVGLMTLDSEFNVIMGLTPTTQQDYIKDKINSIEKASGGTVFTDAINRAGEMLIQESRIKKRHIIVVTDGAPGDNPEDYEPVIQYYHDYYGVSVSVVGVGLAEGSAAYEEMKHATDLTEGKTYCVSNTGDLTYYLMTDLNSPALEEVNYETYNPTIYSTAAGSALVSGLDRFVNDEGITFNDKLNTTLNGFYGVKVRESDSVDLVLVGDYDVPLYAQWKVGNGSVGSFMCDLQNSTWSSDFMTQGGVGQQFIKRVINNLMPTENLRPTEIDIVLKEDNYTNQLSVYANLDEGESVTGKIENISSGVEVNLSLNEVTPGTVQELREQVCYVTTALTAETAYSRCNIIIKQPGVYKITLNKVASDGTTVLSTLEFYKDFSYSEEYDAFYSDRVDVNDFVTNLATRGDGVVIEDLEFPDEIFENFITALDRVFDPRLVFAILAICLFLLDIAARKFKFKWPHEIYRSIKDSRNKK